MSGKLDGKVVLVTGASRGIGRAVARAFGAQGAHIIAVARTVGGLEELDDEIREAGGESATLVPLDLTDGAGIDRLGGAIFERWKRLDVLIGNAAVLGAVSPLGHIEPDDWEKVVNVNLNANWRLIRSLDPLLRQAEAGRAIFVSSAAARARRPYWGPYSVTKAALEALVHTYAAEIANTKVRANLLDPGVTRTAMRAKAMPGEDPETVKKPEELIGCFLRLASPELEENGRLLHCESGEFTDA